VSVSPESRRFARLLLLIVVVAFGVRGAYVGFAKHGPCLVDAGGGSVVRVESECLHGDELFYSPAAEHLADGGGFTENPVAVLGGAEPGPAADHPPLTIMVLAPVSWLGDVPPLSWLGDDTHIGQRRWAMAVLGTALVVLVGLLGRAVGRALRVRRADDVGLASAALAAVYPGLWISDGLLFSETIANICLVAALLLAVRTLLHPRRTIVLALGCACGLATLARAELVLLVPLVALPAVIWGYEAGARVKPAIGLLVAAGTVLAPWVVFNLARFEEPVLVSTNIGHALAGSNCDITYYGDGIGLTYLFEPCVPPRPEGDQSVLARSLQDRAVDYMREHSTRVPVVMAARVGRSLSLFMPADMLWFNEPEGRERWATMLGLLAFYPAFAFATGGLLVAWRRHRATAWILVAPVMIVVLASALTYGQTRFRSPAEPGLVVLAAVAAITTHQVLARDREADDRGPSVRSAAL
jgi:hypothetical protein